MTDRATLAMLLVLTALPAAARGPELAVGTPKPPPGRVVDNPAEEERAREDRARRAAEDAAQQAHSAKVDASGAADLRRAAFDGGRRAGPLADGERPAFEAVVAAYRAAIDLDSRGEIGAYCRLRLAGAYQQIGDFDATARILAEAVNTAAGAPARLQALYEVALFELQARHRPAEALAWATRARALLESTEDLPRDPDERVALAAMRAKWDAATAGLIERIKGEMAAGERGK